VEQWSHEVILKVASAFRRCHSREAAADSFCRTGPVPWPAVALAAVCGLSGCRVDAPEPPARAGPLPDLGEILFDSNRSGTFGIHRLDAATGEIHTIADGPAHEMFPAPSPDGRWIAYAVTDSLDRQADAEIWICDRDGSDARRLAGPGTFPSFSGDGETVYFEQGRSRLMAVPTGGGEPALLYPREGQTPPGPELVKPAVSPDGTFVAFIANVPRTWHVWVAHLQGGETRLIGQGCEPVWHPDGTSLFWIAAPGFLERTAICRFDFADGARHLVQDQGPPWGHEYFPAVSPDARHLAWGSCPPGQHAHESANYQLFVTDLETGGVHRLTHDEFTNRWPQFLPRPESRR
jgi:Tol biopolymer transport system component